MLADRLAAGARSAAGSHVRALNLLESGRLESAERRLVPQGLRDEVEVRDHDEYTSRYALAKANS